MLTQIDGLLQAPHQLPTTSLGSLCLDDLQKSGSSDAEVSDTEQSTQSCRPKLVPDLGASMNMVGWVAREKPTAENLVSEGTIRPFTPDNGYVVAF